MDYNNAIDAIEEILVHLEKVEVRRYESMAHQCAAIEKLVNLKNQLSIAASEKVAEELQNGSK